MNGKMGLEYTNKDIVERLDQLIAILKLSNADKLDKYRKEIKKDEVSQAILNIVSNEPLDYSTLSEKVAETTGKSERTVKSRIAELSDKKILLTLREGRKTFYYDSGILE